MKKFTQKFFLLSMGLMLSMGASAQRPTGYWSDYEDESLNHVQPMVMYKTSVDGDIYVIPAWDRRLNTNMNTDNGFIRVQKKASDGNGMIVTAMGLLYGADGYYSYNGKFADKLYVWSEKEQDWIIVDEKLGEGALKKTSALQYKDIFNTGQGGSDSYVFKDSKDSKFNEAVQVGQINPIFTIPNSIEWLQSQGGGTSVIDELGKYAFGNSSYGTAKNNRSIFTQLTIPAEIKTINASAFRGINTLTEVIFEEGSTLTTIPVRCFDACWNLKTVTLPSTITNIEGIAFGGCQALNKMIFKSATPPTFGELDNHDIFTTSVANYTHSNVDPAKCVIEIPLGTVNAYVASNEGYLATKQFPLCSKFPLETSSGLMTYCSETDFTFKQYNTTSKGWEAGEMKTYYVKKQDVEIENGKVKLTEVTENVMIPGWAEGNDFGVVLKGTSGTTYDIFYPNGRGMTTALTMGDTENCLKGCVTATDVAAGSDENNSYFIMSGGVFKRIMKDGQCKANRAYIKISGGPDIDMGTTEESRDLILAFPGETTGITAHEVQGTQNDAWYTLQGIQVQQPSKGIFIKNGKKVVIK